MKTSEFVFDPDHRASPEYPPAVGTGKELYEQGYAQTSGRYRLLSAPIPKGLSLCELAELIARELPPMFSTAFSEQIEYWYIHHIAKTVSATDGQFMEFKKARNEGDEKKWQRSLAKYNAQMKEKARLKAERGGGGDLKYDQIVAACRNIGYDLTCSLCAALFFTGMRMAGDEHKPGCSTVSSFRQENP